MLKKILSLGLAAVMLAGTSAAALTVGAAEDPNTLLKDDVFAVYDDSIGYFKGVYPGTTAAELKAEFRDPVEIKNAKGETVADEAVVGTDYTVTAGSNPYKILVYGDTDRDGAVKVGDAILILKEVAKWSTDQNTLAADVDLNGSVGVSDAIAVLKYVAGWDISLGYAPFAADLSKRTAPNEDSSLELTFASNLDRKNDSDNTKNNTYSYVMELAKNESEFCQAYLAADSEHTDLGISLSDFKNAAGEKLSAKLLREDYYTITSTVATDPIGTVIPDALPPVSDSFKVKAGKQQGFFIKVTSDKEQTPGLYRAELKVTDSEGKTVKTAYVYADVWNFALSDSSACKTAFGLSAYGVYDKHSVATGEGKAEKQKQLYTAYYEYMLDNRINIWNMPVDPTSDEADAYMSDPRVNTFLVAGGYTGSTYGYNPSDEYIREAYEKISKNEDWAKKAMFYMVDEPTESGKLNDVIRWNGILKNLYPNARTVVPQHVNYFLDGFGGEDIMSVIMANTTISCPHTPLFLLPSESMFQSHMYTQQSIDKYGTLLERNEKFREEGKEIWWYTAGNPRTPMCNITAGNTMIEHRALFWQQYAYDVEGMLYFTVNDWDYVTRSKKLGAHTGVFVYPGSYYGVDGPVACLRTEIARDGIEDFEYLSMIEERFGEEKAKEFVHRIATTASIMEVERDSEKLYEVRREMAALLES